MGDREKLAFEDALDRAAAHWRRAVREQITQLGLPDLGSGADLLSQLDAAGTPQADLTAKLRLSKQAVQQALDRLEAAGLVERRTDGMDKRLKHVLLTAAGRQHAEHYAQAKRTAEARLRQQIGNKPFARLRKTLRKLAESPPGG
jgi:DNA-binding MarR family transcriptional regulator